jgi:putative endonuclease
MLGQKGGFVYMLTNKNHTVLYVGVTSDLEGRIAEHKEEVYPNSFTSRYNLKLLVYFEFYDSIEAAIEEEKRIKAGSRKKKLELIKKMNPGWKDLYEEL